MQHPKDVKGSDRPLPRNDGKFILDGKRVRFSDYGGSSKEASMSDYDKEVLTASELLSRLDAIEAFFKDAKVIDLNVDNLMLANQSTHSRLDAIELEVEVMNKVVAKNILALSKIEERIAIMQEKIDGVDQEEDTFEELSNEEYLLADEICLEIKEYMSQFVDTDEKVVDNLCEIVMHRIVGDSDAID